MSDIKLTPSQARAVGYRGGPALVSAAAGSGKTRVLTERLMARVLEGEDIDRFLVITFTRAAAAELRGRILSELNARIGADPGNARLRRQSALLYRAKIGTIDSFCTDLVRENAHMLGISPGFALLDEARARAMQARALEDVLDRAYERIETDPDLKALVDSVGAGRDDGLLGRTIAELYGKLRSYPFPWAWAEKALAGLDISGLDDAGQTPWGRVILDDAAAEAAYQGLALDRAVREQMEGPDRAPVKKSYGPSFEDMALHFRDIARACGESWDKACAIAADPAPRLGTLRNFDGDVEDVKAVWKQAKDAAERLRKTLRGESATLLTEIAASRGPLTALVGLVKELDEEYARRKRHADSYDFADMEHMAVELLCDEKGGPTALAGTVSARFAEVMVDEYQDVNRVQETLFRRVSGEGQRLFLVGDVKQAVYRFRMAEPGIFNEYYERFGRGDGGELILLQENFRSRAGVLNACNAVFSRIMSKDLGEVEYDGAARLIPGAAYPSEGETKPELCLLDSGDREEGEARLGPEARYVARRIRDMVEAEHVPVADGLGGTRPVRYGDIALLLRTPGTTGGAYRRALQELGVPVSARQGGAFFDQPEISFTMSLLAVVDNPRQDVPLIAVLRGLPFGFTPDELSAVRAAGKGDMWDALRRRAEKDGRCARVVDIIQDLRSFAREEPMDSLLRRLYDETELTTICGALSDGGRRTGELMQLYEYARRFEESGSHGLFRFVSWLRDLEDQGREPPMPVSSDAVQIMSVHKSKGLEFPVVFLADAAHGWNDQRAGQVLCHEKLGLGMKLTDPVRGVRWPTLCWKAIDLAEKREDLSEQERLLYVAMTRARERLIMTATVKDPAGKLAKYAPAGPGPVSPRILMRADSTAPWLMRAALADGGETMDIVLPESAAAEEAAAEKERPALPADPALTAEIGRHFAWRYPFEASVTLPSKLTATAASELAAGAADPEAVDLVRAPVVTARLRKPDFGRGSRDLTGPERGVAAHLVMQHIDFANTGSEEEIAGEIARMEAMGFLDQRQARAVEPGDILAFFRSEMGQRLLKADKVIREFRFSLLCPAKLWYPQAPEGEQVLLQGVVDCCLEEEGALTVIDFKTDGHMEPDRYTGQLQAYAAAMERIWKKPVREAKLWYLRLRKAADCPLPGEDP